MTFIKTSSGQSAAWRHINIPGLLVLRTCSLALNTYVGDSSFSSHLKGLRMFGVEVCPKLIQYQTDYLCTNDQIYTEDLRSTYCLKIQICSICSVPCFFTTLVITYSHSHQRNNPSMHCGFTVASRSQFSILLIMFLFSQIIWWFFGRTNANLFGVLSFQAQKWRLGFFFWWFLAFAFVQVCFIHFASFLQKICMENRAISGMATICCLMSHFELVNICSCLILLQEQEVGSCVIWHQTSATHTVRLAPVRPVYRWQPGK